jgi:hypothetical protein
VLTGHYEPPVNPPDPVAAALKHLVRAPEAAPPGFRAPLQDLAAILDAEGPFTGLRWRDACGVAATGREAGQPQGAL